MFGLVLKFATRFSTNPDPIPIGDLQRQPSGDVRRLLPAGKGGRGHEEAWPGGRRLAVAGGWNFLTLLGGILERSPAGDVRIIPQRT